MTWKEAVQNKKFVGGLAVTCTFLVGLAFFMPYFFTEVIQDKPGTVLNDFILDLFRPRDWSMTIFVLIYSCVLLTILTNFRNPHTVLLGMSAYCIVTWFRMVTMYVFTLEPPDGMIFLQDPFLTLIVYPTDFAKDLFFSGHISAMTVIILVESNRALKLIKVAATFVVGILLLAQHVHYALDVLLAPLFSYLVYRWVLQLQKAAGILP